MKPLTLSALSLALFALIPATVIAVDAGDPAPAFSSKTYDDKPVSLADFKGKTVVLEWYNKHCPFVKKHYAADYMQKLQREAAEKGVIWLTINSTAADNANFLTKEEAEKVKTDDKVASTEMLVDADGTVGKLYGAKTTPHMFIVSKEGTVVYEGAIDDNPASDSDPAKAKNYVQEALRDLEAGVPIREASSKPYGCSVKYAK